VHIWLVPPPDTAELHWARPTTSLTMDKGQRGIIVGGQDNYAERTDNYTGRKDNEQENWKFPVRSNSIPGPNTSPVRPASSRLIVHLCIQPSSRRSVDGYKCLIRRGVHLRSLSNLLTTCLTVITYAMTDLTYDLKNDVEHVEEGVDKPHGTIIPYPRTLRDMPDPPSPAALALGFELQKQDMSHGC
jgi:hypothetical protein